MKPIPKEIIKELIKEEKFSNTTEVVNVIKEMFRDVLQGIIEAELEAELVYEQGCGLQDIKQMATKNYQTADGMEEKILSLYAAGLSILDIAEQIKRLYDVEISLEVVSRISDKILPQLKQWQNRPLEAVYPFIFSDAIHYKISENDQIITKTAYVILGVNLDGYNEILGIWIGENESNMFWVSILNELKNRGVQNIYLFCADGLYGFQEALEATYPKTEIQRYIIHQIRTSTRYVNYKHAKAFTTDLKEVYTAATEEAALEKLIAFKVKWGQQYPTTIKSWEDEWNILSEFYAYPSAIRQVIYINNTIEELHRQFSKVVKVKTVFSNDNALHEMLYLASNHIVKKGFSAAEIGMWF